MEKYNFLYSLERGFLSKGFSFLWVPGNKKFENLSSNAMSLTFLSVWICSGPLRNSMKQHPYVLYVSYLL